LENRGSKDDKMSRGMWKAMEASIGKIGVGKTKEGRSKRRSQQKERRKG